MAGRLYLLVAACSLCVTSSAVFGSMGQWLRNPSKVATDDSERFANILRLRGGEGEKKSTDKITGCCIGIDLGTTYRYTLFSTHKFNVQHNYPEEVNHVDPPIYS